MGAEKYVMAILVHAGPVLDIKLLDHMFTDEAQGVKGDGEGELGAAFCTLCVKPKNLQTVPSRMISSYPCSLILLFLSSRFWSERSPGWVPRSLPPRSLPPLRSWRRKENVTARLWTFSASGSIFPGFPSRAERLPEPRAMARKPFEPRPPTSRKSKKSRRRRRRPRRRPSQVASTPRTWHLGRRYVVGASKPLALCRHSRDTR